jgi:integrase/recombinase XerD
MLEDFFVVPAAAERLRSSMFGEYLDEFCSVLVARGYALRTIRLKLWTVAGLARWLAERHLSITDLDERRVDELLNVRRRWRRRGARETVLCLLGQLRAAGIVSPPAPVDDESQPAALLRSYEAYLRQERGLAECTIGAHVLIARELVDERLAGGTMRPEHLHAGLVRDFLLARVRSVAPARAQYAGTALRSFLRFLFLRGETRTDLAFAVPRVRRWRLANVPRHIPAQDVERVLRACDRTSATGRRDYAVLLLLARLGVRASEVVALELGDLRWREGEIIVRGKGLIRDRVPMLPDVGNALARYLQADRPPSESRRVFLCSRAPLRGFGHSATVSTIVARALARAGVASPMRGAHLLRHSLATAMVRSGASLTEIGEVLRHRSPSTTEIYAKLDFDALRDVAMPWPTARGAR